MPISDGITTYVPENDGRVRVLFAYDGIVYDCGLKNTSCYITIMPHVRDEVSEGGVFTSSERRNQDAYDVRLGYVIDVGSSAFPSSVFPNGPMCKPGDWVSYQRHSVVIDCILDPRPLESREVYVDGTIASNKDLVVGIIADSAISQCYGEYNPEMLNTNYHIGK